TAALESRAGDEKLRLVFDHSPDQFIDGRFLMLREIVVAAKSRRDHFAAFAQGLLKRAARTDETVSDLRPDLSFRSAADLSKKLVEIMDDADFFTHTKSSDSTQNTKSEPRNPKQT